MKGSRLPTSAFTVPSSPSGDETPIVCTPVANVGSVETSRKAPEVESGRRVQKMAAVSVASPAATPWAKALVSGAGNPICSMRSATWAWASVRQRMARSSTGSTFAFGSPMPVLRT